MTSRTLRTRYRSTHPSHYYARQQEPMMTYRRDVPIGERVAGALGLIVFGIALGMMIAIGVIGGI